MVKLDSKTIQTMLDVEAKLMEIVDNAKILWEVDEHKIFCEVYYEAMGATPAFRLGVDRGYFMLASADELAEKFSELLKDKILGYFFKN